jgi:hypothetical protein
LASEEEAIVAKSVVPVRAFHPECLFRISSALEMWSVDVELGESLPTSLA